jgi:hypothetical protein
VSDTPTIGSQIDPKLLTALGAFGPTGMLIGMAGMGLVEVVDLIIANAHKTTIPTPEEWHGTDGKSGLRGQIVAATFKSL